MNRLSSTKRMDFKRGPINMHAPGQPNSLVESSIVVSVSQDLLDVAGLMKVGRLFIYETAPQERLESNRRLNCLDGSVASDDPFLYADVGGTRSAPG